jgi:hypothetical protein
VTTTGLSAAAAILGCRSDDLLVHNGPPLEIYPSEDTSVWPQTLQNQIERGKKSA